jgi:dihydroneopterin aldolase/D-erythro-7,8-dihydroneopterin triphosphate epimerase
MEVAIYLADEMDRIHIKEILLRAIVGINPDERINKQDVVISITMHVDLSTACKSDDVADTVDYKSVKKRVATLVETSQFFLIEKLAQAIADVCLEDDRVMQVDVVVEKPGALRFARTVGVEITRSRG